MQSKFITLACICFTFWTSSNIFAQSNFKQGYIISLQRDTIYGLINYRTDRLNAKCCIFQKKECTESREIPPGEILGYRFTDNERYYISRSIEVEKGKQAELVFLECLIQSVNSLYFYNDDSEDGIYYMENEGKLIKLNRNNTEKEATGLYPKSMKNCLPALNYFLNGFPDLQTQFNQAPFTRNKVIEIVKAYNDKICNNPEECILFKTEEKAHNLNVAITPYGGITKYKTAKSTYAGDQINIKSSYLAGINVAFSSSRFMSSFALSIDLSISKLNVLEVEGRDNYSGTSLTGKIGIRYRYPSKIGIRPLIEAGLLSQGMFFSNDDSLQNTHYIDNQINPGAYVNAGAQIRLTRNWKHSLDLRVQCGITKDCIERETMSKIWSGYIGYSYLF